MDVTFSLLALPWLDTKNYHIHLNSSDCQPYEITTTHIKIKAPFRGCGTTFVEHSHVIIYYNSVVARLSQKLWPNLVITRIPDVEFPFKCAYERKIVMKQTYQIPIGEWKTYHNLSLFVPYSVIKKYYKFIMIII